MTFPTGASWIHKTGAAEDDAGKPLGEAARLFENSSREANTGSAEPPAFELYNEMRKFAFYNIGWNSMSRVHTVEWLCEEIYALIHEKSIDALGLCEVYNLKEKDTEVPMGRGLIMKHILKKLNNRADQSDVKWEGKTDGHYIFLWDSKRITLTRYEYIDCGVKEHTWRQAQYLQFQQEVSEECAPLHVCHCHNPSSKISRATIERKKTVFQTLWKYVMQQERIHQERSTQSVVANGAQLNLPVAIFGGDFNCLVPEWRECVCNVEATQSSRKSMLLCTSKTEPLNGDVALVCNAWAGQEISFWGKSYTRDPKPFTDNHDVVLVPIRWRSYVWRAAAYAGGTAPSDVRSAKQLVDPVTSSGESNGSGAQPAAPLD